MVRWRRGERIMMNEWEKIEFICVVLRPKTTTKGERMNKDATMELTVTHRFLRSSRGGTWVDVLLTATQAATGQTVGCWQRQVAVGLFYRMRDESMERQWPLHSRADDVVFGLGLGSMRLRVHHVTSMSLRNDQQSLEIVLLHSRRDFNSKCSKQAWTPDYHSFRHF